MYGTIHAVRLTDMKIICLSTFDYFETQLSPNDITLYQDVLQEEVEHPIEEIISSQENVQSIPTLLTSRIQQPGGNCQYPLGFSFFLLSTYDMPRSPRNFGYDYTVERAHAFQRNLDHSQFAFLSNHIWYNAASAPELARFFSQARDAGTTEDGMYFGKISKIKLCNCINNIDGTGRLSDMNYSDTSGVTLLHVLEDMFEYELVWIVC